MKDIRGAGRRANFFSDMSLFLLHDFLYREVPRRRLPCYSTTDCTYEVLRGRIARLQQRNKKKCVTERDVTNVPFIKIVNGSDYSILFNATSLPYFLRGQFVLMVVAVEGSV